MIYPKLAAPNLFSDVNTLKSFALDYGFHGIDWTLRPDDLPNNRVQEARFAKAMNRLAPLEVRYHLYFVGSELGDVEPVRAYSARRTYWQAFDLINKLHGRYATVHVGLGKATMEDVSWDETLAGLKDLTDAGRSLGIRVCLENIISGWTARPELFEKLIRKTGCWGTLDIGHAKVCQSVASRSYDVGDFAWPNPTRILNAHIYHEETSDGHVPAGHYGQLDQRLHLLKDLPLCDWWVLELRDEQSLVQTLGDVNQFLHANASRAAI